MREIDIGAQRTSVLVSQLEGRIRLRARRMEAKETMRKGNEGKWSSHADLIAAVRER